MDNLNLIRLDVRHWFSTILPALYLCPEFKIAKDDLATEYTDLGHLSSEPEADGKKYIYLPKYFWHLVYESLSKKVNNLDRFITTPKLIPHEKYTKYQEGELFKLRDYQVQVVEDVINRYKTQKIVRSLVQATPGFGKTSIANYLINSLNMKPLIIVPNQVLENQWKEEIKKFLKLSDDEIGIIQGSEEDNITAALDKPVTMVKIQSLMSQAKKYTIPSLAKLYRRVGLVIIDECHTTSGGLAFGKSFSFIPTCHYLGLSATPLRKGLHQMMIQSTFGTDVIKSNHLNLIPRLEVHVVDTGSMDERTKSKITYMSSYIHQIAALKKVMSTNEKYFQYIALQIEADVKAGHKVGVIFTTNNMIASLTDLLQRMGIAAVAFTAKTKNVLEEDYKVLVSNSQLLTAGFDDKELSTMYLCNNIVGATPIIQACGRILRLCEGKKDPVLKHITPEMFKKLNGRYPFTIKSVLEKEYGKIDFRIVGNWDEHNPETVKGPQPL